MSMKTMSPFLSRDCIIIIMLISFIYMKQSY